MVSRLHAFIGGIIREQRGVALCVGGVSDHVHLLVGWRTNAAIADLVRHVKTRSSRWMHEQGVKSFAWQEGYAVFSVSQSMVAQVHRYVQNQRAHHARRDFKSEYLAMLRAHDVDFDERYVLG